MAVRTPLLNYYEILGVPRTASQGDIESAFKGQMLRIRDVPGSGEQSRRLSLAYRALSNKDRRRDYDAAMSGAPPPPSEVAEEPAYAQAEAPAEAEPETYYDDDYEEGTERRRSRILLLPLLLGALLLIAAGLWASGLLRGDSPARQEGPRIAERGGNQQGGAGPTGDGEPRGGDLVDALSAILPSAEPGAENGVPPPEGTPIVTSTISGAEPEVAADSEVPAPPADEPATPEPEDDQAAAPPPAPAPEVVRPSPPPSPPAPAIDRSSGPRLVSGGLVDGDNVRGQFEGTVGVRLSIGANGRAQGCRVSRSSGNAALDSTTCRLLQDRLVFAPARDRNGNPVSSEVVSTHVWGRQQRR